jgi:hypothetical protein
MRGIEEVRREVKGLRLGWRGKKRAGKGVLKAGNEIGRNHPQEEGEIGREESKENRKQLQQATDWRNHEGRCGRKGEPRAVGKPNPGKCSGSAEWILGGDGSV